MLIIIDNKSKVYTLDINIENAIPSQMKDTGDIAIIHESDGQVNSYKYAPNPKGWPWKPKCYIESE